MVTEHPCLHAVQPDVQFAARAILHSCFLQPVVELAVDTVQIERALQQPQEFSQRCLGFELDVLPSFKPGQLKASRDKACEHVLPRIVHRVERVHSCCVDQLSQCRLLFLGIAD